MLRIGRPRKWQKPEDLIQEIESYFNSIPREEYSVTGLALALGSSRQLLDDYQKRAEFKEIIQEAKLIVENSYELSLRKYGRSGDIFGLKNFGWTDKTETDLTSKGKELSGLTVTLIGAKH